MADRHRRRPGRAWVGTLLAGIAVSGVLLSGSVDGAAAQTMPPTPTPEPSPTPVPSPSPPDEPDPPPGDGGGGGAIGGDPGGSGTIGAPEGGSSGEQAAEIGSGSHRRRGEPTDGCAALAASVPYLGAPRDTSRLAHLVHRLARRGFGIEEAWIRSVGPFPVAGPSRWGNDWHASRCEPYPHLHQGIDIFAPHGSPVVAIEDGLITQKASGSISGLGVEIVNRTGVQFFYAHLSRFHPALAIGSRVEQGDVLGYIGTTGNAQGTSPHVHLEVQPGGVPVPPKPYVDRWLMAAERTAARMLRASEDRQAPGMVDGPSPLFLRAISFDPGQGVSMLLSPAQAAPARLVLSAEVLAVAVIAGIVAIPIGFVRRPRRASRIRGNGPSEGASRYEGLPGATRLT
jgi:murein DD-endopeptidase MepM/ murein hydrolase activator NlpD